MKPGGRSRVLTGGLALLEDMKSTGGATASESSEKQCRSRYMRSVIGFVAALIPVTLDAIRSNFYQRMLTNRSSTRIAACPSALPWVKESGRHTLCDQKKPAVETQRDRLNFETRDDWRQANEIRTIDCNRWRSDMQLLQVSFDHRSFRSAAMETDATRNTAHAGHFCEFVVGPGSQ